ncbi:MAG: DUF294 nucleotidyltransferase-like domain-containing protein [Deinococcota bacterium]|nr:DUF294 nucleotidyltransferase-like domain-containing protein [Deinococcota bacterium]
MEPLRYIRALPPFDRLGAAEFRLIETSLETTYVAPNTRILERGGKSSSYLYLIRKGSVQLLKAGQVVQVLEEGEMFGYSSILTGEVPLDVVAAEDLLVYRLPAKLFHRLKAHPAFADFFMKGLSERLKGAARLENGVLMGDLAVPAATLVRRGPVFIAAGATVGEAAKLMREHGVSSVLVEAEPLSIVTDRDLRNRVMAEGLGPETPVREVMSFPLKSLPADVSLVEVLLFLLEENVHHLPLTAGGEVVGVVTDTSLLEHYAHSPVALLRRVARSQDAGSLRNYASEVVGMVEALTLGGVAVEGVARAVSTLNDRLTRTLLELAEAELGPPPTPYAWLVLGSEGRLEQVLLTDQDNALVYGEDSPEARGYMKALAGRVVEGLLEAGFPRCPGGYMATRWNDPLEEWRRRFAGWVHSPEPQALLEASIFFDFRAVHGALALDALEEVLREAGERGIFLAHLARTALEFRPPLGLFRQIREAEGGVDLKKGGIVPIVSLARVYALAAKSPARPTLDRLEAASSAGSLSEADAETLSEAFRFLSGLRLGAQLEALRAGRPATNKVPLDSLSPLSRRHLKEAFFLIRGLQEGTLAHFHAERLL